MARIRKKNEKSNKRGGGRICAPRAKHGLVPKVHGFSVHWVKFKCDFESGIMGRIMDINLILPNLNVIFQRSGQN